MELKYLNFVYKIESKKFESFHYILAIDPPSTEDLKIQFSNVITIFDSLFQAGEKRRIGSVQAKEIEAGFDYRDGISHGRITYQTGNQPFVPTMLITLTHEDAQDRLLTSYDRILQLPELTMSEDAEQATIRIEKLRQGGPDELLPIRTV
jgi:hypothetical protein